MLSNQLTVTNKPHAICQAYTVILVLNFSWCRYWDRSILHFFFFFNTVFVSWMVKLKDRLTDLGITGSRTYLPSALDLQPWMSKVGNFRWLDGPVAFEILHTHTHTHTHTHNQNPVRMNKFVYQLPYKILSFRVLRTQCHLVFCWLFSCKPRHWLDWVLHHCLEHSTGFQLKRGSNTKLLTCAFSVSQHLATLPFWPSSSMDTNHLERCTLLTPLCFRFCLETFGRRSVSVFGPTVWKFLTFISQKNSVFFNFQKEAKTHLFEKHLSWYNFASVFFHVCRSVGACVCVCVCDILFVGMAAGVMYIWCYEMIFPGWLGVKH